MDSSGYPDDVAVWCRCRQYTRSFRMGPSLLSRNKSDANWFDNDCLPLQSHLARRVITVVRGTTETLAMGWLVLSLLQMLSYGVLQMSCGVDDIKLLCIHLRCFHKTSLLEEVALLPVIAIHLLLVPLQILVSSTPCYPRERHRGLQSTNFDTLDRPSHLLVLRWLPRARLDTRGPY